MRSAVSFQPIPVLIDGHDTAGNLVLYHGQLVAVVVRLDGECHHQAMRGQWHLEAGFGPCQANGTHLFDTLDAVAIWADNQVRPRAKPALVRASAPEMT
jgi:hypothetical protein